MAKGTAKKKEKQYKYYTKVVCCPDGTRKYIRGKTKKELEEKVKDAEYKMASGVNINDNTTFGQLTQAWLDLYKSPRNKPQSMLPVLGRINKYILPRLGGIRVSDVKPIHIAQVMLDASKLCRRSQAALIADMRAIFNLAIDNQLIARSPVPSTLKPSSPVSEERTALTPKQCSALLDIAKETKRTEWAYNFILIGLYTGMRAGEICGLCWDCVNFESNTITVKRQVLRDANNHAELTEVLKTSNSAREIPVPAELIVYLRQLRAKARTIYVLTTSQNTLVSPAYAHKYMKKYSSRLGFHAHPHLLRHTYATRLIEAGLDIKEVQYLLGHSTPDMTLRIYTHYDQKSRAEITAKKIASVTFVNQPVANMLQTSEA